MSSITSNLGGQTTWWLVRSFCACVTEKEQQRNTNRSHGNPGLVFSFLKRCTDPYFTYQTKPVSWPLLCTSGFFFFLLNYFLNLFPQCWLISNWEIIMLLCEEGYEPSNDMIDRVHWWHWVFLSEVVFVFSHTPIKSFILCPYFDYPFHDSTEESPLLVINYLFGVCFIPTDIRRSVVFIYRTGLRESYRERTKAKGRTTELDNKKEEKQSTLSTLLNLEW